MHDPGLKNAEDDPMATEANEGPGLRNPVERASRRCGSLNMQSAATWASLVTFVTLIAAPALAQPAIPDVRGTWKGTSESIIMGSGNPHHAGTPAAAPRFNQVEFTLIVDKQDGRRFSGTFSSARGTDPVIAVISRTGAIYMVDDDGYTIGSVLAPNRLELCYMMQSPAARVASCTEMTKQP
jgi:hypothetical protein